MTTDSSQAGVQSSGPAWFFAQMRPWLRPYRSLAPLVAMALLVDAVYESASSVATLNCNDAQWLSRGMPKVA